HALVRAASSLVTMPGPCVESSFDAARASDGAEKAVNRLLTRAAQNQSLVFAGTYRAATVRERSQRDFFSTRKSACALLCLALAACGYSNFTLPPLPSGDPRATYQFEAQPMPVLGRGTPGEWDSGDALNPSVIRNGELYNFYSGFDGKVWR